jgi:H/ACA ribonucleoprotein complex subunit 4
MAQRKKSMITAGKLDKHGKPNAETPTDFLQRYKDYSKPSVPSLTGASSNAKSMGNGALPVPIPKKEDVEMGENGDDHKKRAKADSDEDMSSGSDAETPKKKGRKEKKAMKKKEKKAKKARPVT